MRHFQPADLKELSLSRESPCVSLYSPAHPGGAEEDATRWRNLVRLAEAQLAGMGRPVSEIDQLLQPARDLSAQAGFWRDPGRGIACFSAAGFSRQLSLPASPVPLAAVGPRFRVVPLLGMVERCLRFHVLALSANGSRLLRCESGHVMEVPMPDAPTCQAEALLAHDRDDTLSMHTVAPGATSGRGVMYHGHGVGIDDAKDEILRYFQMLDKAVAAALGNDHAPLMLASVASLWPIYRKASSHPCLMEHGIRGNPDRIGNIELMEKGILQLRDYLDLQLNRVVEAVADRSGAGRVEHDLNRLVEEAREGHVATLLVRDDLAVLGNSTASHAEEAVDFVVSATMEHGGEARLVPCDRMPGGNRLAGLLRAGRSACV